MKASVQLSAPISGMEVWVGKDSERLFIGIGGANYIIMDIPDARQLAVSIESAIAAHNVAKSARLSGDEE